MKKIAITGASGFVGQNLTKIFESNGYSVVAIKRAQLKNEKELISVIDSCEVVINLAGANIISRWSEEYKKILYSSRIDTTKAVVQAMQNCENKPKLFISTSAVGIYSNQKVYDEENIEYADDFLGNLCKDWEKEALKAQEFDIRTVVFRFGIVMGKDGGALSQMLTPFKLGVGGTIGDGSQAFSFIHIDDLVSAYKYAHENESIKGTYNMTAPIPTTNKGLTKALGKTLNRPTILPLPQFVLQLIFSEGAKVLTDGQSVVPKRLQDSGFEFKYKTIEETIQNLLGE
jgi:uncharacterized protein (TIGR01777 family)